MGIIDVFFGNEKNQNKQNNYIGNELFLKIYHTINGILSKNYIHSKISGKPQLNMQIKTFEMDDMFGIEITGKNNQKIISIEINTKNKGREIFILYHIGLIKKNYDLIDFFIFINDLENQIINGKIS